MTPIDAVAKHSATGYGGVVAVALAAYIALVISKGNLKELTIQLGTEFAFVKWGIALIILWIIIQELGDGLGSNIALVAFLALILIAGDKVFPQIQQFFKK